MSSLPQKLKRNLFWVVARTCFGLYRRFPVFGSLGASIAIIRSKNTFLVIRRNDGRGVSLPGGIASRGEAAEDTLRREVREETGLSVTEAEFQMKYHSSAEVPVDISVFRAQARGELKDSWEGSPQWMTVEEIGTQLLESQRPLLELMRKIADEG